MWRLWHFGNANENIGPYHLITGKYDLTYKTCKNNLSRARKVMNRLIEIAKEENLITSSKDITQGNTTDIFDHAYNKLVQSLYQGRKPRGYDININRIGNLIK